MSRYLRRALPPSVALLLAVVAPANAVAASAHAGEVKEVVRPRLLEDPGVQYPRGALQASVHEHVEVTLILELDATGSLVRATVETPRGHGFDEAALSAAAHLRFEPARRGTTPVAAKIRYRYVFEPPPPTLRGQAVDARTGEGVSGARVLVRDSAGAERTAVTARDGAWTVSDVSSGRAHAIVESPGHAPQETDVVLVPGDETRVLFRLTSLATDAVSKREAPVEVTVRGERHEPAVSSYTRAEIRQIPGAFGDPFRAVETLPGVTPIISGLPFFYVRGAPPGNAGYYLDGVRVPYLYHVGAGPSVVQPAMVERVDFYPGAYPASFGRYSGGIITASTTEPRTDFHGEATLRLFDVGGVVESGFGNGRGSVLLGGRYSYTAALLSLAAPDIQLDYHDFQARVSYDLTPDDRVSVFGFSAYDLLKNRGQIQFASEFYRTDVRYDHRLYGGNLRTAVTLGYDRTNATLLSPDDKRAISDRSIATRVELDRALDPKVFLHTGANVTVDAYGTEGHSYSDPDSPRANQVDQLFSRRIDHATGAWVDLVLEPTARVQIRPGLRADLYGSGANLAVGVDPRLVSRLEVAKGVRIIPAVGLAHQPPAFIVPLPGVAPALGRGLQRTLQTSAGAEVDVAEGTTAGTTGFYNAFFGMTDAFSSSLNDPIAHLDERSRGWGYGVEAFVRRRLTQHFGGFVSYTFSRSIRRFRGQDVFSAFDRTHVANVAASYDLGRGWRAGARFLYYTGAPASNGNADTEPLPATSATKREAAFHRVDVRLEKRWTLSRTAWISFVFEFLNATLRKETLPGGDEKIGPISIPSLGAEAGF